MSEALLLHGNVLEKEELKMDHYRVVACEYVEWAVLDMHLN